MKFTKLDFGEKGGYFRNAWQGPNLWDISLERHETMTRKTHPYNRTPLCSLHLSLPLSLVLSSPVSLTLESVFSIPLSDSPLS